MTAPNTTFCQLPHWVIEGCGSDSKMLHLLVLLYSRADNKTREAYPGTQSLADSMGCSTSTVERARARAQKLGLLTWKQRKDGLTLSSNVYYLAKDQRDLPAAVRVVPAAAPVATSSSAGRGGGSSAGSPTRSSVVETIPKQLDSDNETQELGAELTLITEKEIAALDSALDSFVRFWKEYPRSEGKAKALEHWRKMSTNERDAAIASLPLHALHVPDKTFAPHGSAWLYQRRWEDDLDPAGPAVRLTEKRDLSHRTGGSERTRSALQRLKDKANDASVLALDTEKKEITNGN